MIIGIDLGTSNSLVSYFDGQEVKVIKNVFSESLTPSVVGIDDEGNVIVGKIAKERIFTNPDKTVSVFKRFMGSKKNYNLDGKMFTPIDLSALILKSLKEDAEKHLGEECNEAIISVPAYFNNGQREATIVAAKIAGLKVERLISEPTAAAIAYGLNEKEEGTFMVLDIGGGTFDVSILEMFEGVMQVIAISGDNFLGGEDFTKVIMDDFLKKQRLEKKELNNKETSYLYYLCEKCKIKVSEEGLASFKINLKEKDIEYTINKIEFEELSRELLSKISIPILRALKDSKIDIDELDAVVLIGGATRMPLFKNYISKILKTFPFTNIDPDKAVCIGASIQGALKEKVKALEEVVLTDVCPYTLGIEIQKEGVEDGYFSPIIERNKSIPISKVEKYTTIHKKQKVVTIKIFQGEGLKVKDNLYLGEIEVSLTPKDRIQEIYVRFTYDRNGVLEVIVTKEGETVGERLVLKNTPGTLSNEEIEKSIKKLESLKVHPREKSEYKYLIAKGEKIYSKSLGEIREFIGMQITEYERILERQDREEIEKASKELEKFLDMIEEEIY